MISARIPVLLNRARGTEVNHVLGDASFREASGMFEHLLLAEGQREVQRKGNGVNIGTQGSLLELGFQ